MADQSLAGITVILLVLVMVSALAVVYVKYDARLMFNQLQKELREQDRLGVEWNRLQLEQNTWSSNNRIEKLARTKLNLQAPTSAQIVYVKVK
ncbi:MAG: cell division protein FtsL [Cycloclasticus pugetii]|jgi:cell division protein FtsL|uniref:Cell division protein FtsL n=2 Tax=Cycloclasticus TaxID=34067 RepID=S5TI88_9GAMM|nr:MULTISPECIES: cell division protein FtsL [Cycloclasticus]AFT66398.1 Cell division protein, FtsL-like protein [Cycloclasticus sp. P1]AGS40602.1 Cell division protein FtsL [Cycloclasticus zancles 78-ME]ATI04025.1 cell division protein FtsL [Cycloclasticus sp. PY97N]EPD12244.1 Cell division protein, FtsL-like protein [Cycloclasticus pugetii]MBV1898649.1 cell division protein FtsL [Cycloclasticus sp.]|tara:strand:- start:3292 stop:3570 length:279 start_codon:yes stop_codon:yes gene_type:complete